MRLARRAGAVEVAVAVIETPAPLGSPKWLASAAQHTDKTRTQPRSSRQESVRLTLGPKLRPLAACWIFLIIGIRLEEAANDALGQANLEVQAKNIVGEFQPAAPGGAGELRVVDELNGETLADDVADAPADS